MAVRYKGQVMTEVKFNEIKKAEQAQECKSLNLMQKLNMYFFGEPEISVSDWLWYYGSNILMIIMGLFALSVYYLGS